MTMTVEEMDADVQRIERRMHARRNSPQAVAKRQAAAKFNQRRRAIHESGHAIVGVLLGHRLRHATIKPLRDMGGHVLWESDGRPVKHRICSSMGGALAEITVFGAERAKQEGWKADVENIAETMREIEPACKCVTDTPTWGECLTWTRSTVRQYLGCIHKVANSLIEIQTLRHGDVTLAISLFQGN